MQRCKQKGENISVTIVLQHIRFFTYAQMRTLQLAKYTEPLSHYNQNAHIAACKIYRTPISLQPKCAHCNLQNIQNPYIITTKMHTLQFAKYTAPLSHYNQSV